MLSELGFHKVIPQLAQTVFSYLSDIFLFLPDCQTAIGDVLAYDIPIVSFAIWAIWFFLVVMQHFYIFALHTAIDEDFLLVIVIVHRGRSPLGKKVPSGLLP